jgi:hypothetical protein
MKVGTDIYRSLSKCYMLDNTEQDMLAQQPYKAGTIFLIF